ncbi:MAG: adenylate kinase [Desulfurococcales archaeon ex4484_58]|nr:MAG: adenylate kinase [Desulfurococcales archaeon ex4484_58]
MKAVFIGPPGAGKGTYASYFSRKYCIPHISTGDIFRDEIAKGTELGEIIKKYIDKGELVPDDIVIEVVKKRLNQPDTRNGFILDGFPRTLNQAKALDEITQIDVAVYIYVPIEIAIERLSNRYICPKCHRIYNLKFNPPKNDLRCDYDGEKLIRRPDDEPEVVKNRYKVYYEQSHPVIDYYRRKNLLIEVDNSSSAEIVVVLLEKTLIERGILKLKPCNPNVSIR